MAERVELLYFEDCPGWRGALDVVRAALDDAGLAVPVTLVAVEDAAAALAWDFHGSPTVRVDGRDIATPPPGPPALACRTYRGTDGRATPVPPRELIATALGATDSSAPTRSKTR